MKSHEFSYEIVKMLGFEETLCHDEVYEREYGFPYKIITLDLNRRLFIRWAQEDRTMTLVRINNRKDGGVLLERIIEDKSDLIDTILWHGKNSQRARLTVHMDRLLGNRTKCDQSLCTTPDKECILSQAFIATGQELADVFDWPNPCTEMTKTVKR